jgi:hypothetical protein
MVLLAALSSGTDCTSPQAAGPGGPQVAQWRLVVDRVYPDHPDAPLSSVRQILPLEAGGFAILDAGTPAPLVFDETGALLHPLGRDGEGPGEFRSLLRIGIADGELWVHDPRLGRITTFEPQSGRLGETWLLSDLPEEIRQVVSFGCRRVIVAVAGHQDRPELRLTWHAIPNGTLLNAQTVRWAGGLDLPLPGEGTIALSNPFATSDVVASSADGSRVVVVRQPAPSPHQGTIEVQAFDEDGNLAWTVGVPYRPETLSRDELREWAENHPAVEYLAQMGLSTSRNAVESILAALGTPRFHPAIDGDGPGALSLNVQVDNLGRAWINRRSEGWVVVSQEGLMAEVKVPEGIRIQAIRDSIAWGVQLNDLGVPHLVRLRVVEGWTG